MHMLNNVQINAQCTNTMCCRTLSFTHKEHNHIDTHTHTHPVLGSQLLPSFFLSTIPKHLPKHVNHRLHINLICTHTYVYIYIYIYVYIYIRIYIYRYIYISCMISFLSNSVWALEALHSRRSFAWFRLKLF